ncbi:Stk1 family PASTA domain-containing Ser/Thr kinase [Janibacter sp. CX7]|uniref:Stk1 family PASTA domain-containing Ser/Thr kinase n=1 Tax=Janibacter sp. CX7 TaxID=2963431 RepID=UPI0020CC1D1C|nr:Stk1 family PASTA domain-containing Ser/Thr kinase [Janibacter sp. CX7]UTT67399.1 Stk1 family PASTA domain-containing Ser/Thr kinase [Janibacter sp. CX7]
MTTASTHPLVGDLVDGRYRVLRHLADGGMATVLLATDTRLDREVALKVMRPDLAADETFVSRFRREARSAARLSHPNVVPVFDQGEDGGQVFLAMEYVEGRTARAVVDAEGALTVRAALDVLEPVLTGLAAAHEAGYIHRDVKPENILIPDRGAIKVADFGLARAVTSQTTTAEDGVLFGTVAYLSPEQVERGIADARSDVYACGLILFELLTGRRAVDGESPIHVAFQHVHGSVPLPSERVADLPPELDDLVALATARDPDERPRDAGAYLAELQRVRAGLSAQELDRRPQVAPSDGGDGSDRTSRGGAARGGAAATVAHPRPERTQAIRTGDGGGAAGGGASTTAADLPSTRKRWPAALAALLLVAALAVGGGWWWTQEGPGSTVLVPDVTGLSRADAEASVTQDGDLSYVESTAFDEQVPKGEVITSNPPVGTELSKGSDVTVVVSKGPERYEVPDLAGRTAAQARTSLGSRHLALGTTTEAYDDEVPAGEIVSTSPAAGTEVKRDAKVSLVVSKGPEPVAVPTVTGQGAEAATTAIEKAGLEATRADDAYSTTVPKGSVISQSPSSGTLLPGETVTITVSKGPEMVAVPSVEGLSRSAATSKLQAAGFKVSVQTFLGGPLDEVRASRPSGGTAPKGSTVTILVV